MYSAAMRNSSRVADMPRLSSTDRKSTRLNSSHLVISYAVFCLKKKKNISFIDVSSLAIRHGISQYDQTQMIVARAAAELDDRADRGLTGTVQHGVDGSS